MIRNKRTIYATCISSIDALTMRSTMPRLAAPIPSDDLSFDIDTDSHESIRQREATPSRNPSRTPLR
jgi:hypothetical protein